MCRTFDVLRRRFCWFVLPALFLLWACSMVFTENAVCVSVDGQVRSVLPLDQDGCFVYSYTHSVEKTEVREFFRVEHGGLTLFRTDMQSFGAGLPSDYGDGLVFKDGWYSIKLNRKVPVLNLRVSRDLDQKIAVGERKIDLSALAPDGIVAVTVGRRLEANVRRMFKGLNRKDAKDAKEYILSGGWTPDKKVCYGNSVRRDDASFMFAVHTANVNSLSALGVLSERSERAVQTLVYWQNRNLKL